MRYISRLFPELGCVLHRTKKCRWHHRMHQYTCIVLEIAPDFKEILSVKVFLFIKTSQLVNRWTFPERHNILYVSLKVANCNSSISTGINRSPDSSWETIVTIIEIQLFFISFMHCLISDIDQTKLCVNPTLIDLILSVIIFSFQQCCKL